MLFNVEIRSIVLAMDVTEGKSSVTDKTIYISPKFIVVTAVCIVVKARIFPRRCQNIGQVIRPVIMAIKTNKAVNSCRAAGVNRSHGRTFHQRRPCRNRFAIAVCVRDDGGLYSVHVLNDTLDDISGTVKIRHMDIKGYVFWEKVVDAQCGQNQSRCVFEIQKAAVVETHGFFRVDWQVENETYSRNYFPRMWKDYPFEIPDIECKVIEKNIKEKNGYKTIAQIDSRNYARFLCLNVSDSDITELSISDDYFDLIPLESKQITLLSNAEIGNVEIKSLITNAHYEAAKTQGFLAVVCK